MKTGKRILSILLSLMLVLGAVSVGGVSVSAEVPAVTLWGDANCDNQVDMADVVLIMQSLANPNRYGRDGTDDSHITLQGEVNADVYNHSNGITSQDAIKIQEYLLGKISYLNPNRGTGASSSATASDKNSDINADVSFSFTDENGSNKVNLASGENRTIEVDVNIDAGNNPISALDVQFTVTNGIKISEIYDSAEAFRGVTVSRNIDNLRANYTTLDGDSPKTAESGKSAFMIDVEVPAGTPDGVYYVDFSSCKIFKDNTSFNYTVSADPLKIVVGNETMEISTYSDLRDFASRVNSGETGLNAILMNDIECKNDDGTAAKDWTPIGNVSNNYIGTFDGDGHVITGLSNAEVTDVPDYVGLFGYVGSKTEGGVTTKGTVKNVGLEGGSITGSYYVGGVAGENYGTVTNCCNTGNVSDGFVAGGVVGYNLGTITNCYNTGAVSGTFYVGGVIGNNVGAVTNCYNTGEVFGSDRFFGGVVGCNNSNDNNKGSLKNCYNTGSVTATGQYAYAGGVVGYNMSTTSNCYNTGNVLSSGTRGGIAGLNEGINGDTAAIKNCYIDANRVTGVDIIGYKKGEGAIDTNVSGLTTAQMTGDDALSDSNMKFVFSTPEENPWLTKANGADVSGKYFLFYPHLKGFDYDLTAASEDWPAKVEVSATWSGKDSYTYNGQAQMPSVTSVIIGDSSAPEGTTVTYFKYTYSGENNNWEWAEISDSQTVPGKYRMTIRDGDEVIETKYFTILEPGADYTVSYSDAAGNAASPVNADKYKAIVTFTDTGYLKGQPPIEKEFTITPKSILSESVSVTLSQDTAEYTGGGIMPEVTEVKVGEIVLSKNADYIVSYEDNINASENAKVTVTGKGNYKDSVEKMFTISPAGVTLTANSRNTDVYDGTEKTVTGFTSSVSGLTFEGVTASGSGTQAGSYDVTFTGVTINVTKDSTGNYVVTATENGTLTINPAAPGTSAEAEDIDYGQTAVVTFTVPADAKGKVTFTLDEAESGVTKDIENGQAVCEFENLTIGSHKVECVYTGDSNYESGDAAIANFEVKSIDCALTINYVYADGTEAAETYTDSVEIFKDYSVTSPAIEGCTPDITTVEGTMGDEDMDGKTVTVTYTANTYKVTYVVDGEKLTEMDATFGQSVPRPRTPQREGYSFKWVDEIPATMPAENITINGKFTVIEYTATFVDENGETVEKVTFTVETESIIEPDVPEKAGYAGEWEEYTFGTSDITIKPVYANITSIQLENYEENSETGYKEDKTFTVKADDLPEGAEIHWFVNGEDVGTGESYTVEDPTDDYTVQAKVLDKDGNVVKESAVQKVKVKNGFFDRLIAFILNLIEKILGKAIIDFLSSVC